MESLAVIGLFMFASLVVVCITAAITGVLSVKNIAEAGIHVEVRYTLPEETHSPISVADPTLAQDIEEAPYEPIGFDHAIANLNEFMTTGSLDGNGGANN